MKRMRYEAGERALTPALRRYSFRKTPNGEAWACEMRRTASFRRARQGVASSRLRAAGGSPLEFTALSDKTRFTIRTATARDRGRRTCRATFAGRSKCSVLATIPSRSRMSAQSSDLLGHLGEVQRHNHGRGKRITRVRCARMSAPAGEAVTRPERGGIVLPLDDRAVASGAHLEPRLLRRSEVMDCSVEHQHKCLFKMRS